MEDVTCVGGGIEHIPDILAVDVGASGVACVVEEVGCEDALVARERNGFEELCALTLVLSPRLDVVARAPGSVNPVCACLKDVVLEEVLVDHYHTRRRLGEGVDAVEIPGVEAREVVKRQSVPCRAFARTCYRLLEEWRPHIAVGAADAFVVVAAAVVPQAVVLVPHCDVLTFDDSLEGVDAVSAAPLFCARHEAGDSVCRLVHIGIACAAVPPRRAIECPGEHLAA